LSEEAAGGGGKIKKSKLIQKLEEANLVDKDLSGALLLPSIAG
jgi:hypothetical protein